MLKRASVHVVLDGLVKNVTENVQNISLVRIVHRNVNVILTKHMLAIPLQAVAFVKIVGEVSVNRNNNNNFTD